MCHLQRLQTCLMSLISSRICFSIDVLVELALLFPCLLTCSQALSRCGLTSDRVSYQRDTKCLLYRIVLSGGSSFVVIRMIVAVPLDNSTALHYSFRCTPSRQSLPGRRNDLSHKWFVTSVSYKSGTNDSIATFFHPTSQSLLPSSSVSRSSQGSSSSGSAGRACLDQS